jgi:hypothetical protein
MWLNCSISPGQFPSEYAISGVQHNGKPFSLFAPLDRVFVSEADENDGAIQVELLDRKGDLALVRLPAETFENGQHVTVRWSELRAARTAEFVGT